MESNKQCKIVAKHIKYEKDKQYRKNFLFFDPFLINLVSAKSYYIEQNPKFVITIIHYANEYFLHVTHQLLLICMDVS